MRADPEKTENQYMIRQKVEALEIWIEGFLRDCRVRELSPYTIEYYQPKINAGLGNARRNLLTLNMMIEREMAN